MRHDYIRVALYLAWRTLQALVIIPGALIAMVVVGFAMANESPVTATVSAIYAWAETAVRPAPAGFVMVSDPHCAPEPLVPTDKRNLFSKCRDSGETKAVPIAGQAAGTVAFLNFMYRLLVGLSLFGLLVVYVNRGRAFVGLSPHEASSAMPQEPGEPHAG
jgi:hypothetical protein